MLKIGHIELPSPVVQAALSGYSDWPMRTIARRLGAPYAVHEVMIETFVNQLKDRERTRRFLMVRDADHPVGAQLMGSDPDEFPAAARRLVQSGFDVIDINFGCPMKKLRGQCRGGLTLGQPETALTIVQKVRESLPESIPVTVKMRRGLDDTTESRDNFFRILEGAFALGIAAATIHGRTVQQKYVGPSNWNFLREVRAAFPDQTLLGSGDLFTAADCVRMLKETGVNGVTAARGSIGNPWIFLQAQALLAGRELPPPPTVFAQRDVIVSHLALAEEVYPDGQASRQLRKFGIRYAEWHPDSEAVRDAFVAVSTADDFQRVLQQWYSQDQPGQYPQTRNADPTSDADTDGCNIETPVTLELQ